MGQPEGGAAAGYEAQKLSLVDVNRIAVVHILQTDFRGPVVPAFALWDGELLTHSGLEVPEGSWYVHLTGAPNRTSLGLPPARSV